MIFNFTTYQLSFYDYNFLKKVSEELKTVSTLNGKFDMAIIELDYTLQNEKILQTILPLLLKQLELFNIRIKI